MPYHPLRTAFIVCVTAAPAVADISVSFRDSAPKDVFIVSNTSDCPIDAMTLTLDLSASASGLIFDTTASGAGVEVFQPFEIVDGREFLNALPRVADGATRLDLAFSTFPPGAKVQFTIDVDDTLPKGQWGQIRVSGGEMAGAEIAADGVRAAFNPTGLAVLPVSACVG